MDERDISRQLAKSAIKHLRGAINNLPNKIPQQEVWFWEDVLDEVEDIVDTFIPNEGEPFDELSFEDDDSTPTDRPEPEEEEPPEDPDDFEDGS